MLYMGSIIIASLYSLIVCMETAATVMNEINQKIHVCIGVCVCVSMCVGFYRKS